MFDFTTILRTLGGSLASTLLLAGGCLAGVTATGCVSLSKDQVESQRAIMQSWTDFARDNGVSFVGQASYSGRGGLYLQQLYGVDLGLSAHGTFFFDPSKSSEPK